MSLEQAILEKVRTLPPDKQQEILDFAESLQIEVQRSTTRGIENEPAEIPQPRSMSSLGERLMAIRQQAIENGMQPLTFEEVEQEIAAERDRHHELWAE